MRLPSPPSPRELVRRLVPFEDVAIPEGRFVDLPGRGRTYVTDIPGPEGAPTVVLLHALWCTGMLTWFPAIEALAEHYRVVVFDQRWHGEGIKSDTFSLYDCADDVAALAEELELERIVVVGYSLGSIVAQRVWRQHPELVRGIVLCATTDRFQNSFTERAFHQYMAVSMATLRGLSHSGMMRAAGRRASQVLDEERHDIHTWAIREWRKTSPWAMGQAVAALGQHHSRPWLRRINVPTAVVVTLNDKVFAAPDQRALAASIPGATLHEAEIGHAGCVLESETFVPVLLDAIATTVARSAG